MLVFAHSCNEALQQWELQLLYVQAGELRCPEVVQEISHKREKGDVCAERGSNRGHSILHRSSKLAVWTADFALHWRSGRK